MCRLIHDVMFTTYTVYAQVIVTIYTNESQPTPIYEDIAEATDQSRTTPHTSSEVVTPSQLPPPLPDRAATDNNILVAPSQIAFTTPLAPLP